MDEEVSDPEDLKELTLDPHIEQTIPDAEMTKKRVGDYDLVKMLGRGGMGQVWLGHDAKLDRMAALKMIRQEMAGDESAISRFYREARAVAKLSHPNITQIYQIGEDGGCLYFAMEYVEGETVSDRLKRQGSYSLADAAKVLIQVIDALSYACSLGIIHRDIKPGNILIDKTGRAKIADFGLAKMLENEAHMTSTGVPMGSPSYMSPEQARGQHTDFRSDMYSLGITFFQMLTGSVPHTASTPVSVLLKQVQDPLPEPDQLKLLAGGAIMEFLKRTTAKAPSDRFLSYDDMRAAFVDAVSRASGAGSGTMSALAGFSWENSTRMMQAGMVPASGASSGAMAQAGSTGQEPGSGPSTYMFMGVPGQSTRAMPSVTYRPARNWKKPLLIGAAVLGIAGIGAGAYMWISDSGSAPAYNPPIQPEATAVAIASPTSANLSSLPPAGQQQGTGGMGLGGGRMMGRQARLGQFGGGIAGAGAVEIERARELGEARRKLDFEAALAIVQEELRKPNMLPRRQETLRIYEQLFKDLVAWRAAILKAAATPGAHATLTRGNMAMTLIGANGDTLYFQDPKGEKKQAKWGDLQPPEAMDLARQLLTQAAAPSGFEAFQTLFPPPNQMQGGQGGPPGGGPPAQTAGAAQPPAAAAGAPMQRPAQVGQPPR